MLSLFASLAGLTADNWKAEKKSAACPGRRRSARSRSRIYRSALAGARSLAGGRRSRFMPGVREAVTAMLLSLPRGGNQDGSHGHIAGTKGPNGDVPRCALWGRSIALL